MPPVSILKGGCFASSIDAQQPKALPVRDGKMKVIGSQLPALSALIKWEEYVTEVVSVLLEKPKRGGRREE